MPETDRIYYAEGYGRLILDNLASSQASHRYVASKIIPFLSESNVEIGPGLGAVTACIPGSPRLTLCETSADNCQALKARFLGRDNIHVVHASTEALPGKDWEGVGTVYSANVLEHVEDDTGLIRAIADKLGRGGKFVAVVPAMEALFSNVDAQLGHFRRYSRRTVEERLHGLPNLRLIHFRYFNAIGAAGWHIKYKLFRSNVISERDARLVNLLIPLLRLCDAVPLPVGQSLIFVLEKIG